MKKRTILLTLFLFACISCFAENMSGFWGIPYGTTQDKVIEILKLKKDCSIENISKEKINVISTGTWVDCKIKSFALNFYNNKFYYAELLLEANSAIEIGKINSAAKLVVDKYQLTQISNEKGVLKYQIYEDKMGNTFEVWDFSIANFMTLRSFYKEIVLEKENEKIKSYGDDI